MFEYHGWATLRDSEDGYDGAADDLTHATYDAVQKEIADLRNDLQVADLRIANGSAHLWLAGLRNHRQRDVIEVFQRIAGIAPWSYGLLHVYDDEDQNRWITWVMKRGSVTPEADSYLSPHVGVVEDAE
ncbi:Imm7 family immunity protein [Kribbella sp. NPDC054772]